MKASPQIHSIYIATTAGDPMVQIEQARIISGEGIEGDRYAAGLGAFSKTKQKIRHVSIIALSGIADANSELIACQHTPFEEGDTRRNLVINHISADDLNQLVGKKFYLGDIAFKGTELCVPCQRPANLLGRPDFIKAFLGRGGLRAEALESGFLVSGDSLRLSDTQEK